MDIEKYNWISTRAHEIWLEQGQPGGHDRDHWYQAVTEYHAQHLTEQSRFQIWSQVSSVLVVDDEPLIRFATMDALEDAGFTVYEAGNAGEALLQFRSHSIDAVFTDINMPGPMDGLGLVKLVRANYPNVRILVTSGHVRLGGFDLAGGVAFIPKPYDLETVTRLLRPPF
jgi:CheY-like chemotaxis protein